eukprot:tig00021179_g19225.t1
MGMRVLRRRNLLLAFVLATVFATAGLNLLRSGMPQWPRSREPIPAAAAVQQPAPCVPPAQTPAVEPHQSAALASRASADKQSDRHSVVRKPGVVPKVSDANAAEREALFGPLVEYMEKGFPPEAFKTGLTDAHGCAANFSNCFDVSRCSRDDFRVYVYPKDHEINMTFRPYTMDEFFHHSLPRGLRSSIYYTDDASEACAFFELPSCVNDHSCEVLTNDKLQARLEYFGDLGMNHMRVLVSDDDDPKNIFSKEIFLRSNARPPFFREGFDISVPLPRFWPGSHTPPAMHKRPLLLAMKARRYKSHAQIRNEIHKIDNGKDVIIRLQCCAPHKPTDERCEEDDRKFKEVNMADLLRQARFGLVLAGWGSHSYRLVETMEAGAIPVVLIDDLVMPFHEVVDWSLCAVRLPEARYAELPAVLRRFTMKQLNAMFTHCRFIFDNYMKDVDGYARGIAETLRWRVFGEAEVLHTAFQEPAPPTAGRGKQPPEAPTNSGPWVPPPPTPVNGVFPF